MDCIIIHSKYLFFKHILNIIELYVENKFKQSAEAFDNH